MNAVIIPDRLARRPRLGQYPVPFFVAWYRDGKQVRPGTKGATPDFRVVATSAMEQCVRMRLCWLCGERLGAHVVFVAGPIAVLQRGSAEPPSHRACAEYAVRTCPFMVDPDRTKRDTKVPEGTVIAGHMAAHNPGIAATYVCKSWRPVDHGGHVAFAMDYPLSISWWREGRPATRREVLIGMEGGIQELLEAVGESGFDALFRGLEPFLPPEARFT